MTPDNRALWELVEKWRSTPGPPQISGEAWDAIMGFADELAAILERPVVVGSAPPVSHTVEEVMEFAELLDKHYGAFMQKPIQMLLNYAALIGTKGLNEPNESMVRGKS